MEYGDAINDETARRALEIARELKASSDRRIRAMARDAVARAYCVCVTDGEDAAEHGFSEVHSDLIDDLVTRLEEDHANSARKER